VVSRRQCGRQVGWQGLGAGRLRHASGAGMPERDLVRLPGAMPWRVGPTENHHVHSCLPSLSGPKMEKAELQRGSAVRGAMVRRYMQEVALHMSCMQRAGERAQQCSRSACRRLLLKECVRVCGNSVMVSRPPAAIC